MTACVRPLRLLGLALGAMALAGTARAQAPAITTQPAAARVNVGATATLSVVATGATQYLWYKDGNGLTDGGDITGSATATLTLSPAQTTDSGNYTVTVSNATGYVNSSAATAQAYTNTPFTYAIAATGAPTAYAASNLPAGLALDPSTGVISGLATAAGQFTVGLSAANSLGTGTLTLSLSIGPPPIHYVIDPIGYSYSGPALRGVAAGANAVYYSAPGDDTIWSANKPTNPANAYLVVAGKSGEAGAADGPAAAARFFHPSGLAMDAAGNLYIADSGNDTIRMLSAAGIVTTLAGSPQQAGSADGTGSDARFNNPTAVAAGSDGTVYVADTGNHTIRKISPAGAVTTLAGLAGASGSADGTGSNARFNGPTGLAVDSSGNVYATDTGNDTIREITSGGAVTTLAGVVGHATDRDGPAASATFNQPSGIAVDAAGNVFVGDTAIREIVPGGTVSTITATTPGYYLEPYAFYPATPSQYSPTPSGVGSLTGLSIDANAGIFTINPSNQTPTGQQPAATYAYNPIAITAGPTSGEAFAAGSAPTLSVAVSGSNPSYSWATQVGPEQDALGSAASVTAGFGDENNYLLYDYGNAVSETYYVLVYNAGSYVSATTTIEFLPTPTTSLSVPAVVGAPATLTCSDANDPTLTFQWLKDGAPIPGATGPALEFAALQASDAGTYTAEVTTALGSTVTTPGAAISFVAGTPVILTPPTAQSVYAGGTATLTVSASGSDLSYQWQLNGVAIPGATSATLTLSAAEASDAGSYSVVVTDAAGSITSAAADLSVNTTRLANLSVRGAVGTGADALIVGFVTSGDAAMQLLLRGVGPGLENYGVTGVLAEPLLQLYDQAGTLLATDAGWGGNESLAEAFTQVGAFALAGNSTDSALLVSAPGGAYTAQLSGVDGTTGNALAEIYDADPGTPDQHLVNLSARGEVGTGAAILIGGFVVSGNSPETVLIRGIGPSLGQFGLADLLAQPQLQLLDAQGNVMASNTTWGGTPALAAAMNQVGAFPLSAGSADAALLATLPPGDYTAQLSGLGSTTGLGLLEIYEVRPN